MCEREEDAKEREDKKGGRKGERKESVGDSTCGKILNICGVQSFPSKLAPFFVWREYELHISVVTV